MIAPRERVAGVRSDDRAVDAPAVAGWWGRKSVFRERVIDVSRGDDLIPCKAVGAARRGVGRGDGIARAAASRGSQRGYTLLEIIVAFAVFGLALTLLLGILSGGVGQVRWSADSARAALHAQSLLDVVGVGEVLMPGRREGGFEDGRYRWVLDVDPYLDRARVPGQPVDPFAPQLLQLSLQVQWGEGGPRERLQLESLRLVQPDPSGVGG